MGGLTLFTIFTCAFVGTQAQELCDLQPFIEANLKGVEPCKTCFFPSFPGINSINMDAYKPMDFTGEWIYFHGDSTLRQVYGEVRGIIDEKEAMGFAELRQQTRTECSDQGRESYVPPPHDDAPCYVNEATCNALYNSTGMGRSINITYDWKHFMYEDYDRWLYNRWISEGNGPTYLFISPGLHECWHEPTQYKRHARRLRHLVQHLSTLQLTVVYIDMNVVTRANGGADALKCTLYVNTAAHALAREFQMLMFSRQSMMVSANGPNEAQEFPLHQPDEAVALEAFGTSGAFFETPQACLLPATRVQIGLPIGFAPGRLLTGASPAEALLHRSGEQETL